MRSRVLFLCTGNACRSQMAEGWTRYLHGSRIDAWSAGVAPGGLDPRAVAVMAEAGVDIGMHTSKHVDELLEIPFDLVVTVCDSAAEHCPVFPGRARMLHHGFDDPPALAAAARSKEEALSHYRCVRDQIRSFVEDLPTLLNIQHDAG